MVSGVSELVPPALPAPKKTQFRPCLLLSAVAGAAELFAALGARDHRFGASSRVDPTSAWNALPRPNARPGDILQ